MLSFILLAVVVYWLVRDYVQDSIAGKQEKDYLAHRTKTRRESLLRNPGSPAAHETLGDALRAEGDLSGALAAYEEALSLTKYVSAGSADVMQLSAAGLENKRRSTKSEMVQREDPAKFGMTLKTRQQICRVCASLCLTPVTARTAVSRSRLTASSTPCATTASVSRSSARRSGPASCSSLSVSPC